ncbi:hypothetical protein B808_98 [Fructilactobacillus florum 8D]|uniref:Uncharacterized protein n=1 Tax=Fructilactobacillus florum 8D TaxID=1221538 RepID=W9EFP7_9LACO|nr:hypothetical protein B807_410 [Fructilactobacillus florum 2F]ETO40943.1 hypothetical protein B808_98 [Fructilactobacillus florum 8D]
MKIHSNLIQLADFWIVALVWISVVQDPFFLDFSPIQLMNQ